VMIYLAALIIWLYYGLSFNITSLPATSAIFTIVIGLALQSTLGNLFSGVALELERPLCLENPRGNSWSRCSPEAARCARSPRHQVTLRWIMKTIVATLGSGPIKVLAWVRIG